MLSQHSIQQEANQAEGIVVPLELAGLRILQQAVQADGTRYCPTRWWIIRRAPAKASRAHFSLIRLDREADSSCGLSLPCLAFIFTKPPTALSRGIFIFLHAQSLKHGTGGKGYHRTSRVDHRRVVLPAAMAGVRCR
jgi:hypothetical protein